MRRFHPAFKILLWTVAFLYLFFPRDLIPDLFGWVGRLDDLALILWIWWLVRSRPRRPWTPPRSGPSGKPPAPEEEDEDPYAVLGVPRGATGEAILEAYRRRMAEYHPDKVAHLGEDLKRVAHEKTLRIQRAYEQLLRGV